MPRSMRLAMATSLSRGNGGTARISRRYSSTGSLDLPNRRAGWSSSASSPRAGSFWSPAALDSAILIAPRTSLRCRNIFVDVDAVALESGEQVVDLFCRAFLGREDVVHFVIDQLTAFLAEVDEVADLAGFS